MSELVETTVIGSYPVMVDTALLMKEYYKGMLPSWKSYINKAVSSMCDAGIDLVSDGQTRDPFIHIFARGLEGCRIRSRAEVVGPVVLKESITKKDLSFVSSIIPKGKKLLGLIVGPYTLSESVVDLYYHDAKELAFAFANALKKEVEHILPFVDMISIDEPFFANKFPEYGQELIALMVKNVSCPTRLHVCGDVSPIVAKLLDFPVDILSHEFTATPELFTMFSEYDSSMGICLGCVRSDKKRVETTEEIIEHMRKGESVFGSRIRQVAPDCGLRMLPESAAFEKLKNLVDAKRVVYG